jgi:hypothetical protein
MRKDDAVVELADIKKDLPLWPDEVIEQWLLKLANRGQDTGWPPPEPLGNHAWKYILGGRPLSWWKAVSWKLESSDLTFDTLCAASKRIVHDMLDGHVNGRPNAISRMPNSRIRFLMAGKYVSEHGTLPEPPLVIRLTDGLSVLDANHRVAALCFRRLASERIVNISGVAPEKTHKVWVCEPPTRRGPELSYLLMPKTEPPPTPAPNLRRSVSSLHEGH